jgi:hypothetical protein
MCSAHSVVDGGKYTQAATAAAGSNSSSRQQQLAQAAAPHTLAPCCAPPLGPATASSPPISSLSRFPIRDDNVQLLAAVGVFEVRASTSEPDGQRLLLSANEYFGRQQARVCFELRAAVIEIMCFSAWTLGAKA